MKTLIISRHGKAVPAQENQQDMLRELTPRGQKDAELIAHELQRNDIIPGLILSSPAVRAVETGRFLADYLEIPGSALVTHDVLYGDFNTGLFTYLDTLCPEERVVLIVGHNPSLLLVIEFLSGLVLERFPTLTTIVLDFEAKQWRELTEKKGTVRKLFIPRELR
jgi:phosphohistidine phosphatase